MENNNNKPLSVSEQQAIRMEKLPKYLEKGVDPFGHKFDVKDKICDLINKYKDYGKEQLHEMNVQATIAGRIMSKRDMGKIAFVNVADRDGNIQLYIRKDVIGEDAYNLFKLSDIGDIIGVSGEVMKTNTGELSIKVIEYTHLTKALRPLPEKFHGLTDIEERYRRRYVDLIVNKNSRDVAIARTRIIRSMQHYFDGLGFIEVDTPILQSIHGGAAARPFVTHHNSLDRDFYLRIATELSLKRLLVGGLEKVYEIGRIFRNEGMDTKHSPEFTTVELYQAYGDLSSMMELSENCIKHIAKEVFNGQTIFPWNNHEVDLSKPFRKVSMVEIVKEVTGIDFSKINTYEEAVEIAKQKNVVVEKHHNSIGHILNLFFDEFCEEKLIQPTFLYGHPVEISPFAKEDEKDPRFTQRFELYICGCEIANAFTELNDPIEQRKRLYKQLEEKKLGNDEACEVDVDFIEALEYGMPPAGGIGIGIDRLVMFFTNSSSVRDVILFPHMRD